MNRVLRHHQPLARYLSLLLVTSALLGGAQASPAASAKPGHVAQSSTASPVDNGRIVFVRNAHNGETDVASMTARGQGFVNITHSDANELYVDVSPDGRTVAFTRFGKNGGEIYTASISGGAITRLTSDRIHDELPIWSSDSTRIAFVRYPKDEQDREIFVMDADGTNRVRITTNDTDDADPRWSPDGTQLIYNSGNVDDNTQEINLVTLGEPGVRTLTDPGVNDSFAEWSPDGQSIVYSSLRGDQWDLFVVSVDGSSTAQLTNDPADDYAARWSSDGTRLLFVRGRLEGSLPRDEVYVMEADGTNQRSVSPARLQAFSPVWSPNGRRIAFIGQVPVAGELPEWEIFTVRRGGSDLTRLTRTAAEEFDPGWAARS